MGQDLVIVAGVDGWKGRWVAVFLQHGKFQRAEVFDSLTDVVQNQQPQIFGIDVPIGLAKVPPRAAEAAARSLLGPRRSSVFDPPAKMFLDEKWAVYREANQESKQRFERGISAQGFALMKNIREADRIASKDKRCYEVHPELTFRAINGAPLTADKKSWNGLQQRMKLLKREGIKLPTELPEELIKVPADDLLDAAAAAWSAMRIANGDGEAVLDTKQRLGRIWF